METSSLADLIISRAGQRLTRSKVFEKLGGITVYVKPWTVLEREKAVKWARAHNFTGEYEVDVCILKACDEAGKALFTAHDRVKLVNFGDPDVIGEMCDFLIGPEEFVNEGAVVESLGEPSPVDPA